MTSSEILTGAELNAYVDGELPDEDRLIVEQRLASDPEAARKASELARLNDAIKSQYAAVLDEPLPPAMQAALTGAARPSWGSRWMQMAAAIVLLVAGAAAGYVLRGVVSPQQYATTALLERAVSAHTVYVSEVRHPVEVDASEEAHLVKWLTKRLGAEVRAPSLSSLGYDLLGGRLLPASGTPAAQFMYQNTGGKRLTLYVRSTDRSGNVAFQYESYGALSAFYWIDRPLAYALIGELPRGELLAIARITYEQLN